MEQKKNSQYIIPATFFTSLSPSKKSTATATVAKPTVVEKTVALPKNVVKKEIPKRENMQRRRSALSLKSIHEKREAKTVEDVEENFDNHPKTPFLLNELQSAIKKHVFNLTTLGENSLASVINSADPSIKTDYTVELTVVSELIKKQISTGKPKLLKHLREELNNYAISITIIVNKTVEKKFVYTNSEKFAKMKEKNPALEILKNTFGLDL